MNQNGFTPEQWKAIRESIKVAKALQEENHEIVEWYRAGESQNKIADRLDLINIYPISQGTAKLIVSLALRGYDGRFGGDDFQGLLDEEEAKELAKQHNIDTGKMTKYLGKGLFSLSKKQLSGIGKRVAEFQRIHGLGLYALSSEEKAEAGRKSGKMNYEEGKGIFSMSEAKRREARYKGLLASGKTPFVEREETETYTRFGEKEFMIMLAKSRHYQHFRGRPNLASIADILNDKYHEGSKVRTKKAIGTELKRSRFSREQNTKWKPWVQREFHRAFCKYGELEYALMLIASPNYQYQSEALKGKPIWDKIVKVLNCEYHQNKPVRYRDGLRNKIRELKKQATLK